MWIRWIAAMFVVLAGSVVAHVTAAGEPDPNVSDGPPELGIAHVVDGQTIELSRFVERMGTRTVYPESPPGGRLEAKSGGTAPTSVSEVASVVETQTLRTDATAIVARRVDGRMVPSKVLKDELAKPTAVILASTRGQRIDPVFSKLFKRDSLVLFWDSPTSPPQLPLSK
jgi:hypothetical protein